MSAVGAGRGARASPLPHPDPGVILLSPVRRDHARGNAELARLRPGLAVLGADERICALTRKLVHGEELRFGAIHVRCLLTPGHTSGHMSYFLWEEECPDPPAVFSGDALSVAGCGLRLESTAQQMYESLTVTLGSLPPETVSGHPFPSCRVLPSCMHNLHTLTLPRGCRRSTPAKERPRLG